MSVLVDTKNDEFYSWLEFRFMARTQEIDPSLVDKIKMDNVDVGDISLPKFIRMTTVEGSPIGANLNASHRILRIPGRLQIDYHITRGTGSGPAIRLLESISNTFNAHDLKVAHGHSVKFKYANIVPLGVKDRWFVAQSTIMYLRDVQQLS